jgi:hypothetical protein
LKLGKGVAFVKSQFKRLRQENETWEADFRALPKPTLQTDTHYLGLVLAQPHGYLLAFIEIEQTPTVNDFATLLANAILLKTRAFYFLLAMAAKASLAAWFV